MFDWKLEILKSKNVAYKLTITGNQNVIQGLISLRDDVGFIKMELIESAPFNRGKSKLYLGVMGNLVAFACKRSFEMRYEGYILFLSKTKLINHYIFILNAIYLEGNLMSVQTEGAKKLVNKYFNF